MAMARPDSRSHRSASLVGLGRAVGIVVIAGQRHQAAGAGQGEPAGAPQGIGAPGDEGDAPRQGRFGDDFGDVQGTSAGDSAPAPVALAAARADR